MDKKFKRILLYLTGAIFLFCIILVLAWLAPQSSPGAAPSAAEVLANPEIVHRLLKAGNPSYEGQAQFAQDQVLGLIGDFNGSEISDLSPLAGIPFGGLDLRGQPITTLISLKGMPLKFLGIEDTKVSDLMPLTGMKLEKLYMNNTPVSDLGPLAGMPLVELMLADSNVKDIKPLKGLPLQSLWLNNTQVRDISPLAGGDLVSLTLEGTEVTDLEPLSNMTSLKRLHIGETPVSDITPLGNLHLERLIFTPGKIKKGLDAVRNMKTLQEIGTTLETRMSPKQFWQHYDRNKKM